MREHVRLGTAPLLEATPAPEDKDYEQDATAYCAVYIAQLLRLFGPPPQLVTLRVGGGFSLRAGEVAWCRWVGIWFDPQYAASKEYTEQVLRGRPLKWDAQARLAILSITNKQKGGGADDGNHTAQRNLESPHARGPRRSSAKHRGGDQSGSD